MSEFAFILLSGLLPLLIIIAALVLLKRIADGVARLESTLDRRLLRIQQAIRPGDPEAEGRWPTEE
jgi:hypothetical protein